MRDTAAFLDFLAGQGTVAGVKFGCDGYCMGGHYSLVAAGTYPDRIAAAASFHGGNLATDRPDSPHRLADRMRARLYVGVAGIDPHFPPEEKDRLEAALSAAGVPHTIEVYPDVRHGFAVPDLRIVGDVKYLKAIPVPAAKWQAIAECIWLLQKVAADRVFMVFGRDVEVAQRYLKRVGRLTAPVEFYYLSDNGHVRLNVSDS